MVTTQMVAVALGALFSVQDQTSARFVKAVLDRVAAVTRGDHGETTAARLLRTGVRALTGNDGKGSGGSFDGRDRSVGVVLGLNCTVGDASATLAGRT